jgi:hypothetical protein
MKRILKEYKDSQTHRTTYTQFVYFSMGDRKTENPEFCSSKENKIRIILVGLFRILF